MTSPMLLPAPLPLDTVQWQERKARPTALGDHKHSPGIDWVLRKRLDKEMKTAQDARGMRTLQAETITSDKAISVDPAFPDNAILIIDDKKETQ